MGAAVSARYAVTVVRPWPPPRRSSAALKAAVICRTTSMSSLPTRERAVRARSIREVASWSCRSGMATPAVVKAAMARKRRRSTSARPRSVTAVTGSVSGGDSVSGEWRPSSVRVTTRPRRRERASARYWPAWPVGVRAPPTQWEMADLLVWRSSPFSAAMRRTSLASASYVHPAALTVSRRRELALVGAGTIASAPDP